MTDDAGGWNVTDAHSRLSPSAGVLSAGGSATVYGRVYLRPTPQIVPADLADVLDPVHDAAGALTDWRLNPAKLINTRPTSVTATWHQFDRWREGYVTERVLGDLATMRAFLAWADRRSVDISALRALSGADVRIDPATATRVAAQAEAAAAAARASDDDGVGVAGPTRPGLLRGFAVTEQPLVVLAAGSTQLSASTEGLRLTQTPGGPSFSAAVVAAAPADSWTLLVSGWSVEADGVIAHTETGDVNLGDTLAGKLLTYTAPGAQLVRTYPVPITSVFASLLTELPALGQLAARNAKPLTVTH